MSTVNPIASQVARQDAVNAQSNANEARNKIAGDLDAFLLMLTTQLQNQDPLSPMESTEFTQQLVGFAQVEQQIDINENLETQIGLQRSSMNTMALDFLGTYVEVADNTVELKDGKAKFAFSLASEAAGTVIRIRDEDGVLVRTLDGAQTMGDHVVTWDGRDNGLTQLPDGYYTVEVDARNGEGEKIAAATTVQARVTGVTTDAGEPYLIINGAARPLSQVGAVTEEPTI